MEAGYVNKIKEAFGQIENVFGLPIIFHRTKHQKIRKIFSKKPLYAEAEGALIN